jgi:tRNA pseudouridine55 synthase
MNGVLIIDKAAGMTSHDVVSRVRRIARERSVGHLGTLDPMATGVLPLVLGKMTRLAQFYTGAEKAYEGNIRFGFSTDTYDAEGEATSESKPIVFDMNELKRAAEKFRGEIQQMPPPFSAKKIKGVPAYKLARRNEPVELLPVTVEVKEFEILSFADGIAVFKARVSSGTYLRSIAHELGISLGTGAHLSGLRRTQVGEFTAEEAITLEELEACAASDEDLGQVLIHTRKLLPAMPGIFASDEQMAKIRHGNPVNLAEFSREPLVRVFAGQGELVCVASRVAGTLFQPKIVLCEQASS